MKTEVLFLVISSIQMFFPKPHIPASSNIAFQLLTEFCLFFTCLPGLIILIFVNICESTNSLFTGSPTELEWKSSYEIHIFCNLSHIMICMKN